MGTLKFNIELPKVSGGLLEAQYLATNGLWWAHWSCIFSYLVSRVGLLKFNIELPRASGGLIGVEY